MARSTTKRPGIPTALGDRKLAGWRVGDACVLYSIDRKSRLAPAKIQPPPDCKTTFVAGSADGGAAIIKR